MRPVISVTSRSDPTIAHRTVAVFLRIRPPNEDRGDVDEETNLRTYEVLQTESDESGNPAKPQTIRTIPPTGSFYIKQTGRQLKEFSFTEVPTVLLLQCQDAVTKGLRTLTSAHPSRFFPPAPLRNMCTR
jgi:hypothetical protein